MDTEALSLELTTKSAAVRRLRKAADYSGAAYGGLGGAALGGLLGGGSAMMSDDPEKRKRSGRSALYGALMGAGAGAGLGHFAGTFKDMASQGGGLPEGLADRAGDLSKKMQGKDDRWFGGTRDLVSSAASGVGSYAKNHPFLAMLGAADAGSFGLGTAANHLRQRGGYASTRGGDLIQGVENYVSGMKDVADSKDPDFAGARRFLGDLKANKGKADSIMGSLRGDDLMSKSPDLMNAPIGNAGDYSGRQLADWANDGSGKFQAGGINDAMDIWSMLSGKTPASAEQLGKRVFDPMTGATHAGAPTFGRVPGGIETASGRIPPKGLGGILKNLFAEAPQIRNPYLAIGGRLGLYGGIPAAQYLASGALSGGAEQRRLQALVEQLK